MEIIKKAGFLCLLTECLILFFYAHSKARSIFQFLGCKIIKVMNICLKHLSEKPNTCTPYKCGLWLVISWIHSDLIYTYI